MTRPQNSQRMLFSALALTGALVAGAGALPAGTLAGPPASPELASATQLGEAFSSVAARVSPAVVSIQVETPVKKPDGLGFFFGPFGRGNGDGGYTKGGGSGVIISPNGDILTNHHVVENARRIEVHLQDGRKLQGKVVGIDPATDLAVLHIDAKGLPATRFADSDKARVGQWVVAIGSPFGLDYTLTAGILSAKGRGGLGANEIEDYLQTDASINPGNSGGPLVNLQGEVLGINTMIIGRASGIGFAIPSNLARQVADQLRKSGEVRRAWIGVSFQELTPELASQFGAKRYRGALVNEVVPSGPAARAGVKPGDIVLKVGGQDVEHGRDLLRLVLRNPVGAKVPISLLRGGKTRSVEVTMGERPDREQQARARPRSGKRQDSTSSLGMSLTRLQPNLARQLNYEGPGGVVIAEVRPGSSADHAGLVRGDVIEQVDRHAVKTPQAVQRALRNGKGLLTIRRHGGTFFAVMER